MREADWLPTRKIDDYLKQGTLTDRQASTLRTGFAERANILIVGPPNSGKTTFANACLDEMVKCWDSFVLVEDKPELRCPTRDFLRLHPTAKTSTADLLRALLRLSTYRVSLGEIRGPEVHPLLHAWNTDKRGGVATLQAQSATTGLKRLEDCLAQANVPVDRYRIADAVQLVVTMEIAEQGRRRVSDLRRITGMTIDDYRFEQSNG
jgi:type IV secretion system protein VirB11